MWSRPVRNGSSAASWSAAPIVLRTFGPSRTTSSRRRPRGRSWAAEEWSACGRSSRLAGAVRAQKAVDLARSDLDVDPVDRFDPR